MCTRVFEDMRSCVSVLKQESSWFCVCSCMQAWFCTVEDLLPKRRSEGTFELEASITITFSFNVTITVSCTTTMPGTAAQQWTGGRYGAHPARVVCCPD